MVKRTLITGAAGFIGHHVLDYCLRETDDEVIILDRLSPSGNLGRILELLSFHEYRKRVTFVYHDLRAALGSQISGFIGPVDRILHLAALTHVDRSIEDPMLAVMENVVGTCNLLEYARRLSGLEKLVYFSTDEVFGPAPSGIRFSEWDRYYSRNPYAATKAGGEELSLSYQNTYGLPVIITHTMNVIGIRQHPEKFIPMTIRKVLNGEEVLIHSNPLCTVPGSRFYTAVEDVCRILFVLLDRGAPGQKYNIVGPEELDNLEVAGLIAEALERPLNFRLVDFHSSRPGHDLRYALNGRLLGEMGLGDRLSARLQIPEIVRWTTENPRWLFG